MSDRVLDAIRDALAEPGVNIAVVQTMSHGRGLQVMVNKRKVGPVLFPAEGQTLADLFHALGSLA